MSFGDLDENKMWQAVADDDERYDGRFVYAVRTTGIYCRPSCKSRTPRRAHVEYFAGPDEAERAGYRPCQRCQPTLSGDASTRLVEELCRYIEAHVEDGPVSLQELAGRFALSPFHLQRRFKRVVGITPKAYAETVRLRTFKEYLRDNRTITESVYAAGYSSGSQLYARVDDHLGMTPTAYRDGGPAAIAYAVASSPFGFVLAATTARGICAVRIGDTPEQVICELHSEFPAAHLSEESTLLQPALEAMLRHMDGSIPRIDLPLDIRATAFQQRVWGALRKIPYGQTRTYGDIARDIGQPGVARAVGNACAANPVAIIVPCHRVVRNDGRVGRYRWGDKRKKKLLDIERKDRSE